MLEFPSPTSTLIFFISVGGEGGAGREMRVERVKEEMGGCRREEEESDEVRI